MPLRDAGEEGAIQFLGKWRVAIVRAQAGLDMADWNFVVESGEPPNESGGRVALDKHGIHGMIGKIRAEFCGEDRGKVPELLAWSHDLKIHIGRDAEILEDLLYHLAVLGGRNGNRLEVIGKPKGTDHGSELDGFRTGSDNDGDRFFHNKKSGGEKFKAEGPALAAIKNFPQFAGGQHAAQTQDQAVSIEMVDDDSGLGAESRSQKVLTTPSDLMVMIRGDIHAAATTQGVVNLFAVCETELNEHAIHRRADEAGHILDTLGVFLGENLGLGEFLQKRGMRHSEALKFAPCCLESPCFIGNKGRLGAEYLVHPGRNAGMNGRARGDRTIEHRQQPMKFAKERPESANDRNARSGMG